MKLRKGGHRNDMRDRSTWLIVFILLLGPLLVAQSRWPEAKDRVPRDLHLADCDAGGKPVTYSVGKYKVKLVSAADDDSDSQQSCAAYLVGPNGADRLLHEDAKVSILRSTGEDLFGNGNPGLILEGFSGGAHCCFTYVFADLGDSPRVLQDVTNQTGFYIFKDSNSGKYRILTWDGAFDYFDDFCHACSPVPVVVLEPRGTGLRDVSREYITDYDEGIAKNRAAISPDKVKLLTAGDGPSKSDAVWGETEETRRAILEIVFAYLYSGREQLAWQTLDQMWPRNDVKRIKALIIDTKAKGILSQVASSAGTKAASP